MNITPAHKHNWHHKQVFQFVRIVQHRNLYSKYVCTKRNNMVRKLMTQRSCIQNMFNDSSFSHVLPYLQRVNAKSVVMVTAVAVSTTAFAAPA